MLIHKTVKIEWLPTTDKIITRIYKDVNLLNQKKIIPILFKNKKTKQKNKKLNQQNNIIRVTVKINTSFHHQNIYNIISQSITISNGI